MNSAYGPPDMSQQVPVGGPGYLAPMAPGPGTGPVSIHNHSSYQHHQLPPPQHHQPPSHHSHANPHPQGQTQVYPQPSHTQQLPHQQHHQHQTHPSQGHHLHHSHHHHEQEHHHHQQSPLPQSQHQQSHQLPHLHHLSQQLTPQSHHLPPQQHQHHHQQHASQPKPQPRQSTSHASRALESSTTPTAGALVQSDKHGGVFKTFLPFSKVDEATGRKYQLDVVQQPRRARMCGFGDKDRRPITPPPCVRLIITDITTGKEVDCNDIDHSMFVLNVDLWSEDGTREVNLVRSSASSPSISSTTPYSYTPLNGADAAAVPYSQHVLPSGRDTTYNPSQAVGFVQDYQVQSGYSQATTPYPPNGAYGPPQQYFPHHQPYRSEGGVLSLPPQQANMAHFGRNGSAVPVGYGQEQGPLTRLAMVGGQPQGMFTRNLIGSLAASAFRLSDTSDQIGIWFVLQDLSVRTEGPFRLRFSFVNVGPRNGVPRDANGLKVNTGRAPILASCFSDVFNVYSAKKFPGVCESTPLSKTFATQGIKIPIRKDANLKVGDGEDDYGD